MRISAIALVVCLAAAGGCGRPADEAKPAAGQGADASAPAAADAGTAAITPGAPTKSASTTASGGPRSAASGSPGAPVHQYREVTLPAGTTLRLRLETTVASDASSIEDPVRATIRQPVLVEGAPVLPEGTELGGVVTAAERSGKVKGRARVAFRFDTLTLDEEQYDVRTRVISRQAQGTKAKDAKTIGIPAAGGAVVGGIIGGKKGAVIGGAAGGGAGTAVVLSTRGEEVRLPAGTSVNARLAEPLTVRVPVRP